MVRNSLWMKFSGGKPSCESCAWQIWKADRRFGGFCQSQVGVFWDVLFIQSSIYLEPETSTLNGRLEFQVKQKLRKLLSHLSQKDYDVAIIGLMALNIVMFVANLIAQAWRHRPERRGLGVFFPCFHHCGMVSGEWEKEVFTTTHGPNIGMGTMQQIIFTTS